MMVSLQKRYGFTMTGDELESYVRREEDVVIAKIKEKLVPCDNVTEVLEKLAKDRQYRLAVVSSSALRRVKASIEKVGQDKYFGEHVYSAATSLEKPTSKPDPAIYLHAMEKMGVKAEECVAVEDSKSGTLSGTRAGIRVIGYVGPYPEDEKEVMEKTLKEAGAKVIMKDWREFWDMLDELKRQDF
jgi:HAD superfamily hydrolase (TIGR01509 family)